MSLPNHTYSQITYPRSNEEIKSEYRNLDGRNNIISLKKITWLKEYNNYYSRIGQYADTLSEPDRYIASVQPDCLTAMERALRRVKDSFINYWLGKQTELELYPDISPEIPTNYSWIQDRLFIDERTEQFIRDQQLNNSIGWLCQVAPPFFPNSFFELELHTGHGDEDDNSLDLRVYNGNSFSGFREQMHNFYDHMIQADHHNLYRYLSITHWRRENLGWQIIPGNSSIS
jgi:hypothetical protein